MSSTATCAMPGCETSFVVYGSPDSTRRQRYCGATCRQGAREALQADKQGRSRSPFYGDGIPRPTRSCEQCGHWFVASTRVQRYCNLSCSGQAIANARREARHA